MGEALRGGHELLNHLGRVIRVTRRTIRVLDMRNYLTEQWEELADRAVMRLTRRFPMPGELHEIASELNHEEELRANSEHLDKMRAAWEQRGDAGVQ
jgi:hypothetical protein